LVHVQWSFTAVCLIQCLKALRESCCGEGVT
jgi:hypothetical protein